ncbi:MAG: hypothetical protein WC544_02230 [Patescibacteria group bacterium]
MSITTGEPAMVGPETKLGVDALLALRDFFLPGCTFYWSGSGKPCGEAVLLFTATNDRFEACTLCRVDDCPVRQKPYQPA